MTGRTIAALAALLLAAAAPATAQSPLAPLSDLVVVGPITGDAPPKVPLQTDAGPVEATPRAECLSGKNREPGMQGRVPAGSAPQGLECNAERIAHSGESGGFRVWRYIDPAGHECAFYDTALVFPLNAISLSSTSPGVAVVDMTDPSNPVQTDTLTELPMLSPHESLNLNAKRGLLAAALGNPASYPGLVSIYSVKEDCRHPILRSTSLVARFGHESGFSADGLTYYVAGTAAPGITAVDVTDPAKPRAVLNFAERSHGVGVSPDGDRLYLNDAVGGNLTIVDSSEIQARKPGATVREIARLTWTTSSIPQNSKPFTVSGHPYLLEFDEFNQGTLGGDYLRVGAARIIDIADERHPKVVSNLRLQVNQRSNRASTLGDPGALSPAQGYAAHYCDLDDPVDPTVVACSFIASGLRVFDISDVARPKEIAYYVQPPEPRPENGQQASDYAMSQPQIIPARKEIWYSDVTSGLNVVRVDPRVWPAPRAAATCRARTRTVNVRLPRGATVRSISARLDGRAVSARRAGRVVRVRFTTPERARGGRAQLVVRVRLKGGRVVRAVRTYRVCS